MDKLDSADISPDYVAQCFIEMIVSQAYQGSIKATIDFLQTDFKPSKQIKDLARLHEWYKQLDRKEQNRVKELVGVVAEMSIFHVLAILDGVAGSLIENTLTELSLHIAIYDNKEAKEKRQPAIGIDVLPIDLPNGFLHDLFQEAIFTPKPKK